MVKKNYQGREITATLQAPTEIELDMMLHELGDYTDEVGLEPIKILSRGPDPDGGWKAVVVAHNFNPVTWLAEKGYRAYLGAKHGWTVGKEKAEIRHRIETKAEVARAPEEARIAAAKEEAKMRAKAEEKTKREALRQKARLARIGTKAEIEAEEEAARLAREAAARELRRERPVVPVAVAPGGNGEGKDLDIGVDLGGIEI